MNSNDNTAVMQETDEIKDCYIVEVPKEIIEIQDIIVDLTKETDEQETDVEVPKETVKTKDCCVKLERLTDSRITDIQKNVVSFVDKLNEEFPNSPYLQVPRRSKRRRSEVDSPDYRYKNQKVMDFLEIYDMNTNFLTPLSIYKRQSLSDSSSNLSDQSSVGSSGYGSTSVNSVKHKGHSQPGPNNNNEYKVEKIICVERYDGREVFLTKWVGYPSSRNTWEPFEHVRDTTQFEEFLQEENIKYKDDIHELVTEMTGDPEAPKTQKEMGKLLLNIQELDELHLQTDLIVLAMIKLYGKARYPKRMLERTRQNVITRHFKLLRDEQMSNIERWSKMVNEKEPSSKIKVINDVDFDTPPDDFVYINKNIGAEGVIIPENPMISCNCVGGCNYHNSKNCCGELLGSKFAYRTNSTLRLPVGMPIFECNSKCACAADCHNRVVQRGRQHKLVIFKTNDGRGWGVRTEKYIPQGHFLCEYTGEVITFDETEKRGMEYDQSGKTYLFDLDFHNQDNNYTIDALKYGNIARFINHSCDPNCGIWAMWSDCQDTNFQRIVFFSLRPIAADEELTIDYLNGRIMEKDDASDIDTESVVSSTSSTSHPKFRPNSIINKESCVCKCGTKNCRKFIF